MRKRTLCDLARGESGILKGLEVPEALGQRLEDLGFLPGTAITCLCQAPAGSPRGFWIRGTLLALRREDCRGILLEAEP